MLLLRETAPCAASCCRCLSGTSYLLPLKLVVYDFEVFENLTRSAHLAIVNGNRLIYLQLRTRRGQEKGRRNIFRRPLQNRGSPQWTIFGAPSKA
jgi:hypothetical protein